MASVTLLPVRDEGWTVEDLDDLPEDGLRYELVDGGLRVSPPPTNLHDYAVGRLVVLLDGSLDDAWRIVAGGGLRFDDRNYRGPDLMVVEAAALRRPMAVPSDVLLVVEVMSPSSVTEDRLVKPAQYAAAGIAHFWRLELGREPALVVHELAGDGYREIGRFTDEVAVDRPVLVRCALAGLLT